jgi:hypothetical protein
MPTMRLGIIFYKINSVGIIYVDYMLANDFYRVSIYLPIAMSIIS